MRIFYHDNNVVFLCVLLLGGIYNNFCCRCCKEFNIVILGMQDAGASTIFHILVHNKKMALYPTKNMNSGRLVFNGVKLVLYDIGWINNIFWVEYAKNADGLILVVDSSQDNKFDEFKSPLASVLNDLPKDVPILVFANKSDVKGHLSTDDVLGRLKSDNLTSRPFLNIVGSVGMSNDVGLSNGLNWLVKKL